MGKSKVDSHLEKSFDLAPASSSEEISPSHHQVPLADLVDNLEEEEEKRKLAEKFDLLDFEANQDISSLNDIIVSVSDVISVAKDVAVNSGEPRMFEVYAKMIDTLTNAIHKRSDIRAKSARAKALEKQIASKKEIRQMESEDTEGRVSIDKGIVFVGDSANLIDIITQAHGGQARSIDVMNKKSPFEDFVESPPPSSSSNNE